jgi:hypothetical protein
MRQLQLCLPRKEASEAEHRDCQEDGPGGEEEKSRGDEIMFFADGSPAILL